MNSILRSALAVAAALVAGAASAEVTFFEHDNFNGRAFTTHHPVDNFRNYDFNDRASSIIVTGEPWEVCEDAGFHGRCMVLRPGNYPSLREMGMNDRLSSAREIDHHRHYDDDRYAPAPLPPQITFYDHDDFHGRGFSTQGEVGNFQDVGFNDRASSIVVLGGYWEVCQHAGFGGRCLVLRPGRYPDLGSMGFNDLISSVRPVAAGVQYEPARYAPPAPMPAYDWRPQPQEQLYQVQIVSTRAVYANAGQHCWTERSPASQTQADNRAAGAVIGGVLGGIIGHQVGQNTGSTVVGAIGGAVVGGAIGNNLPAGSQTQAQQHCAPNQPQGAPQYWDSTYQWHGVEHHVQTTAQPQPGAMVTVNDRGEPRQG
jgi:uncharacterized protein YcfJ